MNPGIEFSLKVLALDPLLPNLQELHVAGNEISSLNPEDEGDGCLVRGFDKLQVWIKVSIYVTNLLLLP